MSTNTPTRRTRWKYLLDGLVPVAPTRCSYDSLMPAQAAGRFTAAPPPPNEETPYRYGGYLEEFGCSFCEGHTAKIRTAYVSVGPRPADAAPVDGILHGSSLPPHVHVPFPPAAGADDRLWLTVQQWDGQVHPRALGATLSMSPGNAG